MKKPTKGRVLIRIEDIETDKGAFDSIENVQDRTGIVVDLAEPFHQFGDPGFIEGDRVKIPTSTANDRYFKEGDETYVVLLQQEIFLYDDLQ